MSLGLPLASAATDRSTRLLAALVEQAHGQGCTLATLEALVEEASQLGAARALAQVGLADSQAGADVRDLRQLLDAWRDARRAAWLAVVRWIATGVLLVLMAGFAWKLRSWS